MQRPLEAVSPQVSPPATTPPPVSTSPPRNVDRASSSPEVAQPDRPGIAVGGIIQPAAAIVADPTAAIEEVAIASPSAPTVAETKLWREDGSSVPATDIDSSLVTSSSVRSEPLAATYRSHDLPQARSVAGQFVPVVIEQLQGGQADGPRTVRIDLTPPQLGPLRMELKRSRAGLEIRVSAREPATLSLLELVRHEVQIQLAASTREDLQFDILAGPPDMFDLSDQSASSHPEGNRDQQRRSPLRVDTAQPEGLPRRGPLDLLA
ncbi:MAG: flagellar hook-length control protein FliK [Planctomycetaceae bacterium]